MSNLLDKASIVLMTPTAYSEGVVHTVKPEIEETELTSPVNFNDWDEVTVDTTIINETSFSTTGSGTGVKYDLVSGRSYKIYATSLTGDINIRFREVFSGVGTVIGNSDELINLDATGTDPHIYLRANSATTTTVSDVSIVEVINPDFEFDRGTEATRVNSKGEVVDVNIIGSELVQNGNFEELGPELVTNGGFDTTLGSELVVNGGFDTGDFTDWDITPAQWSVVDNKAVHNGSNFESLRKDGLLTIGKNYVLTYNYEVTEGALNVRNGSTSIQTHSLGSDTSTVYFTATNNQLSFARLTTGVSNVFSIDNVSVKEVQGAEHWTLGDGWSIEDGKAVRDDNSSASYITQGGLFDTSKYYEMSFSVLEGSIQLPSVFFESGSGTYTQGDYTITVKSKQTTLFIYGFGSTSAIIDNVSVKEVDPNGYWEFGSSNVSIQQGKAVYVNQGSGANGIYQDVLSQNKKYKISFNVSDYQSGSITAWAGGSQNSTFNNTVSGNGLKTIIIEDTKSTNGYLVFGNLNTGNYSLDNISVKEITDDTDIPRINYEDFSYEEVLGEELVVNGGFDTDSDWIIGGAWDVSNGEANFNGLSAGSSITTNLEMTSGKEYEIKFSITSGTARFRFQNNSNSDLFSNIPLSIYTENEYVLRGIATNTTQLKIYAVNTGGGQAFSIDNVSIKEVTQQVVEGSGTAHWLLEPLSTNLIQYSEDFSQWFNFTNVSFSGGISSPDGENNAFNMIAGTITGNLGAYLDYPSNSGIKTYTSSCFVKKGDSNFAVIALNQRDVSSNFLGQSSYIFDLDAEQVSTAKNSATAFTNLSFNYSKVSDEWYRISITGTCDTNAVVIRGIIGITDSITSIASTGNGADYIQVYGYQLEEKPYATSYIPTNGGQATRGAESLTGGGDASLINSEEGVLFVEMEGLVEGGSDRYISLSDGSQSNIVSVNLNAISNRINLRIASNGVNVFIDADSQNQTELNKVAIKYKSNDCSFWINGVKINSNTTINHPLNLSEITFSVGDGSFPFHGKVKQLIVYKEALTDAELMCLTTKRVKEYGEELIVNGDFSDGSTGWTLTTEVDNEGVFVFNSGTFISTEAGKSYRVSFDGKEGIGAATSLLYLREGNSPKTGTVIDSIEITTTDFQKYELDFTAATTQTALLFRSDNSVQGTIDNVSVKEIKSYY